MSELSFLIDLLVNHKLSKSVKELIVERIKLIDQPAMGRPAPRAMPRQDLTHTIPQPAPIPVEQIAQTPEAAAAIASRNEALNAALSGKILRGQERPRKW